VEPGVVVGKRRIQKTTTTVSLSRSGFSTAAYLDHIGKRYVENSSL